MGDKRLDEYRNREIYHCTYQNERWYINDDDMIVIIQSTAKFNKQPRNYYKVEEMLSYINHQKMWLVTDKKIDTGKNIGKYCWVCYNRLNEVVAVFNNGDDLVGRFYGVKKVRIYDNYSEYDKHNQEELRKVALAKLTDAEKKVLGLA